MTLAVHVVLKQDGSVYAAYEDVYDARYEVHRWSEARKEQWTYVPGKLVLEGEADAQAETTAG